jgi:hypothetical protein
VPPGESKQKDVRYLDIYEVKPRRVLEVSGPVTPARMVWVPA